MVQFSYKAENGNGEIYNGRLDVADRFELYKMIRHEGGRVISVSEEGVDNLWSFKYWNSRMTTISDQDKILFARNLGSMIEAGLSLARALSVLERQTKNARLKNAISSVSGDVRRGATLNESLAKFPSVFSNLFVAMVKSGEESGGLSEALKVVSEQMDKTNVLKKKIKSALIYPSIVVVAIIGIGILMLTKVVPTLAQTFEELGADLPASTQTIISISNFLVEYTVFAIALFGIFIIILIMFLRSKIGSITVDWVLLHTPTIGNIVREVNSARTARTMSSLISSGVDMITAISITKEVVQNSYFRDVLSMAQVSVKKGQPLSKEFMKNENLYPPLVGEMMAVGEETGALTDMLDRLAVFYEEEVSRKTKDMSTVIEPFLMLLIGSAVGFFAVSMVSPIYQLSDAI